MSHDTPLYQGRRFRVVEAVQPLPDGGEHTRDVIRHPGAVAILPLVDNGVILIRNRRLAVAKTLWEIPAGTLEPGEAPIDCARRELTEETGYRASRLEKITAFYMSPGILDEQMHLFVARGLTPGPQELDVGEQIETHRLQWEEALAMTRNGQIEDAKTLVALLYWELYGDSIVG